LNPNRKSNLLKIKIEPPVKIYWRLFTYSFLLQIWQKLFDEWFLEMNADCSAFAGLKRFKITEGLCRFKNTEWHIPPGNFCIISRLGSNFNENTIVRPTLMKLTG